jgi:hypothetical protein
VIGAVWHTGECSFERVQPQEAGKLAGQGPCATDVGLGYNAASPVPVGNMGTAQGLGIREPEGASAGARVKRALKMGPAAGLSRVGDARGGRQIKSTQCWGQADLHVKACQSSARLHNRSLSGWAHPLQTRECQLACQAGLAEWGFLCRLPHSWMTWP